MQPKQSPPGQQRTPDLAQDPHGDEYIDIDKALDETSEDEEENDDEAEDLELEGEEDERDEDIPLSRGAGKPDEADDTTV